MASPNGVLTVAPQRPAAARFLRFMARNESSARDSRITPDDIARTVFRALVAKRPRTRYGVGRDATGGRVLARLLPDRAIDRVFGGITAPVD